MRLLADENIPAALVRLLRKAGFDLIYVAENGPGLADDDVLDFAFNEKRPILTEDRDFGEIVFRQKRKVPGVVMLRLSAAERTHWPRIIELLRLHEDRIHGSYVVIDSKRVRIRPLPVQRDA